MFITRECDYAVRVVRALRNEKKISVTEICDKEAITAPFAYKILKKLQKAGIVKGYRGAKGGYALRKSLTDLTLLEIFQAIEPDLKLMECLDDKYECVRDNDQCGKCTIRKEMRSVQMEMWNLLKRKTMEELLS